MIAITVNELVEKLQKIVAEDKANGDLPCYIFPEGGQDILEEWEIRIEQVETMQNLRSATYREMDLPKRLQIG